MRRAAEEEIAPAQSLTDRAYADIEEMIVFLKLAPGSAISEAELSAHLGIGRTPIREALQRLARERLVAILPRRGKIATSRSRASRCSASRIGVRPMPSRAESSDSETALPGASRSVMIISSISA